MDDELIIRLKAEADTAALKRAVKELEDMQREARKMGMSENAVQQAVRQRHEMDQRAAREHRANYRDYINNMSEFANLNVKAGDAAQKAGEKTTQAHVRASSALKDHAANLAVLAGRYVSLAAAGEAVRRSFMASTNIDTLTRAMANQAGRSLQDVRALIPMWKQVSAQTGKSLEEVIKGYDALREHAHLTLEETNALFPAIARGANATRTSIDEMSFVYASMMKNLKLGPADAVKTMDQLTTAFEDMQLDINELTRSMPALTEAWGQWGYTGTEGTAAILAWLRQIRTYTKGTTAEAAQSFARLSEMITDTRVAQQIFGEGNKYAQESLINYLRAAQRDGKDVISAFLQLLDESNVKLEQAFGGRYRQVIRSLREHSADAAKDAQKLIDITGSAAQSNQMFVEGQQKTVDDLINQLHELMIEFGNFVAQNGLVQVLKDVTSNVHSVNAALIELTSWMKGNKIDWNTIFDEASIKDAEDRLEYFFAFWKYEWLQAKEFAKGNIDWATGGAKETPESAAARKLRDHLKDRIGRRELEGSKPWSSFGERFGDWGPQRKLTDEEQKAVDRLRGLNDAAEKLEGTLRKMSWTTEGGGAARVMQAAYHPGGGGGGGDGAYSDIGRGYRPSGAPPMGNAGPGAPEPQLERDKSGKWKNLPWPIKDGVIGPGGSLITTPSGQQYATDAGDYITAAKPDNMRRYVMGIGFLESSLDPRVAAKSEGGNTGFFKFNAQDAAWAAKRGLPDPRKGTLEQQAAATEQFLRRRFPEAAAAIDRGDFAAAHRTLNKFWVSLPGGSQPQNARRYAEYNRRLMSGGGDATQQVASGYGRVSTPWGQQPTGGPRHWSMAKGAGLSDEVAAQAEKMAQMGPTQLSRYMASVGHPKNDAWCGDFAASAVEQAGGRPPKNPQLASNWLTWEQPTNEPARGDIAARTVSRYGGPAVVGKSGSHVTTYWGEDPKNPNRFIGLGGNQSRRFSSFPKREYAFRTTRGGDSVSSRVAGPGAGMTGPEDKVWSEGAPPAEHYGGIRARGRASLFDRAPRARGLHPDTDGAGVGEARRGASLHDRATRGRGAHPDTDGAGVGEARRVRRELEKPIKINMELGGAGRFARRTMRREANREVREARHNSYHDIGAA